MVKIVLAFVIFLHHISAVLSVYCLKYTTGVFSTYSTYIYCYTSCCGTNYNRYCCSNLVDTYTYTYVSVGVIVGAVIGCLFGLIVIIAVIVIIIKACTKKGSHGRVVRPVPPHQQVFYTNTTNVTSSVPAYPPTQPGFPPPYPGPNAPPGGYPQ